MADTKKYYWLKLKDDFFRDKRIKKLRRIAGGDTYTVIYLKMQLLSIKNNGVLIYEGIEDNFAEELALELDEDTDNVKVTLAFLHGNGMLEETEQDHFLMTETIKCIGSESASAERVRKHREKKQKALQCNTQVTIGNTEIEKEKEIDLEIDLEEDKEEKKKKSVAFLRTAEGDYLGTYKNIKLKETELTKLNEEYGTQETAEAIEYLSEYIELKGYKAKSHYLAMRKWVYAAVKEEHIKKLELEQREKRAQEIHKKQALSELKSFYNDFEPSDAMGEALKRSYGE
jgi:predicted phage replisome organizer